MFFLPFSSFCNKMSVAKTDLCFSSVQLFGHMLCALESPSLLRKEWEKAESGKSWSWGCVEPRLTPSTCGDAAALSPQGKKQNVQAVLALAHSGVLGFLFPRGLVNEVRHLNSFSCENSFFPVARKDWSIQIVLHLNLKILFSVSGSAAYLCKDLDTESSRSLHSCIDLFCLSKW